MAMADINCPKCDKRLRVPDSTKSLTIRCPECQWVFSTTAPQPKPAPAHTGPPASNSGLGTERFHRYALAIIVLVGTAFLGVLAYTIINRPSSTDEPSPRVVAMAEDTGAKGARDTSPPPTPSPRSQPSPTTQRAKPPKPRRIRFGDLYDFSKPTTKPTASQPATPSAMSAEELFAKASLAVVRVVVRDENFKVLGQGSGFFVSADGLLVTNFHVIEGAKFATVMLGDNSTLFVEGVAAVDKESDLALLKINGAKRAYLTVGASVLPKVGTTVYAIGSPKGLTNTFSKGMVSGVRDVKGEPPAIQTTAAISPGSSGGPLLAADGRVVGVTTSYIRSGQSLNFAIPASKIRGLVSNRGALQVLASAGGKRLDEEATDQLGKAWAAMAKKDWPSAAKLLTDLRAKQKDNPSVWFALGYLHSKLGNYDIAIQQYKTAIALKPDFASAYFNTGVSHAKAGRFSDAIAAYKAVIAISPRQYPQAYQHVGSNLVRLKRFSEALDAFKTAIALAPDDANGHILLGGAYCELGRYSESLAEYKRAIVLNPTNATAYDRMGWLYHFKLQEYARALAAYKTALALAPTDPGLYLRMARSYEKLGRSVEAIAAYQKSLALKPDADVYGWLAGAYTEADRLPEAIDAHKKSLLLKQDADVYNSLALVYKKAGRLTDTIDTYKKSLALKRDADVYQWLASAYKEAGQVTEAIDAYKNAVLAYTQLGLAYEKAGSFAAALDAYDSAFRLDPDGKMGKWAANCAAELRTRLRR